MKLPFLRGASIALALLAGVSGVVSAQDYPHQAIRLVVPYPPGGSTDFIARLYAEGLSRELKQSVIVDNRPGASTNIGSDAVVKSKADGYTLLFGGGGGSLNVVFGPKPPFDPLTALDPVSLVARVPFMVAANPATPFLSVKAMVSAAKAAPGKFSISSAQLNVYVELMKSRAKINLLHIPYKGGAQATTDAVGGQVGMVYALVPVLLPQVQSGRLKAIGVTSGKRLSVLPSVSTFVEAGIDYEISTWFGLLVPAGTPTPIVEQLAKATQKITTSADFTEKLAAIGAEAASNQPAELRQQMREQQDVWAKLAIEVPSLLQAQQP